MDVYDFYTYMFIKPHASSHSVQGRLENEDLTPETQRGLCLLFIFLSVLVMELSGPTVSWLEGQDH